MDPKHTSIETITKAVGRWNTDIAAGWEIGLQGKQRIGRRLFERRPPEHLLEPQNGRRLMDWTTGFKGAQEYRKFKLCREVYFTGTKADGSEVVITRKGWSVKRGQVVTQLEKQGCAGTVLVLYFEGAKVIRRVNCGI